MISKRVQEMVKEKDIRRFSDWKSGGLVAKAALI
jgi:hypothetical protein